MGYSPTGFSSPDIPVKGSVAEVGTALDIGYKSPKWDKDNENYLHEFEQQPNVYLHEDGKTLIMHPVKFDERGITS